MHNSQELANIIKLTAKARKTTVGKMLSDCSLSVNTLSSMQSGGYFPRLEAICKIADYLDCSVDFLLGRTETGLKEDENDILIAYRQSSPEIQKAARAVLGMGNSE